MDALFLRILDSDFEITVSPQDNADFFLEIFKVFQQEKPKAADCISLQVVETPPVWAIDEPGEPRVYANDLWEAAIVVRNIMIHDSLAACDRVVGVHAAVLVHDGEAVLLAGSSGVGKSTLTLHLIEQGWEYLSDDLAPLDLLTGQVYRFPKPLNIKDLSSWEGMQSKVVLPSATPPLHSYLIPGQALPLSQRVSVKPAFLVFPRFGPKTAPSLRKLSPGEAVARAARSTILPLHAAGLTAIARMASTIPAAEMEYSSSIQAEALLNAWVQEIR